MCHKARYGVQGQLLSVCVPIRLNPGIFRHNPIVSGVGVKFPKVLESGGEFQFDSDPGTLNHKAT